MKVILKSIRRLFRRLKKRKIVRLNGDASARSVFEGENYIGMQSFFDGSMGYGSYIGHSCEVFARIGRYTCIGHDVRTVIATHPLSPFVSIHPMFYSVRDKRRKSYVREQVFNEYLYADKQNHYGVIIGNDVWIGNNATLMGGIRIGDGAVIATGALVTHDVPSYTIVGGVPARKISQRFSTEEIDALCAFRWWDKPQEWIALHSESFRDIRVFLREIEQYEE